MGQLLKSATGQKIGPGCVETLRQKVIRAIRFPAIFGASAEAILKDCIAANRSIMRRLRMITCYLRYEIEPFKVKEFETYAKMWLPLVEKFGGTHHGYFLPHEGGDYVAIALFSFPSLADYEAYRSKTASDPDCQKAIAYYRETKCFLRHDRSFLRPLLQSGAGAPPKPDAGL